MEKTKKYPPPMVYFQKMITFFSLSGSTLTNKSGNRAYEVAAGNS
jgi:hypothetical protein